MINFLITINDLGKIIEVKWSDPIYLIASNFTSFYELVLDNERDSLKEDINNSSENVYFSSKEYTLKDFNKRISLCTFTVNDRTFVFGYENKEQTPNNFAKIIRRFMGIIKEYSKDNIFTNNESIRYEFEKIHTLNNELIDTRRLLEKSNAEFNLLNKELNNRLVKDALTGLISRYQYRDEIEYLISQDPEKFGVFIFIDIDDFKSVNDNYGHAFGDDYLIEFANRLKQLPITNTIKLRIAGDEFGLFIYGLSKVSESLLLENWDIIKQYVLIEPMEIKGKILTLSISAGVSIYGIHTDEIYDLIEYADFAMYKAKKSGKNCMKIFVKSEYENKE